jgi:hypothetical protein
LTKSNYIICNINDLATTFRKRKETKQVMRKRKARKKKPPGKKNEPLPLPINGVCHRQEQVRPAGSTFSLSPFPRTTEGRRIGRRGLQALPVWYAILKSAFPDMLKPDRPRPAGR